MRILFIGGSHPRHLYYLHEINNHFDVICSIVERRESMHPRPPAHIPAHDRHLFIRHFDNRAAKELEYFGEPDVLDTTITTDKEHMNSDYIKTIIQSLNFDVCLIFGCGMIRDPVISILPEHTYNLHLGLSPRYRGAATLFWPFYFLEPNYAGCTFHKIVHEPDAGDIVHQSVPALEKCDTIHDVGCRAVIQASREAVVWLNKLDSGEPLRYRKQKATGKNFLASDFQAQHLRMIYDVYQDNIVDEYLCRKLKPPSPNLWRANYYG